MAPRRNFQQVQQDHERTEPEENHAVEEGNFRGHQWRTIKKLVHSSRISINSCCPEESLRRGSWVKLICGASFEDVVDIRNLSLVYTLAGVDCIDCAADVSVVNAVREGIEVAREIVPLRSPWIMISVNDDEDLHFRKAEFDPVDCPLDCSRPCEMVCPANAISLRTVVMEQGSPRIDISRGNFEGGIITERCYGCGRCFPVCPYDKIRANTYVRDAATTSQLLKANDVDAIEIHTRARHVNLFKDLWNGLAHSTGHLKLVAVSLPDLGDSTVSSMNVMYSIMNQYLQCYNLWQIVGRVLNKLPLERGPPRIEDYPEYLLEALIEALKLVGPIKCYNLPSHLP